MAYLRNSGKSLRTLHTLPKPPPSSDGGNEKGNDSDVKSLPAACV